MPHLNRRGLTLVELLVALVLMGIVSMGIYRVLINNQRVYQAQTQRIDLQQNIRAAVNILPAEFRELDAADGDILAMTSTSITIRAMRQLAIVCATPVLGGANAALIIRTDLFFNTRDFNTATDRVFVFYEGNQNTRNDDSWVPGQITGIAPGDCPGGAVGDGRLLTTTLAFGTVTTPGGVVQAQLNATGNIAAGAPIRGWETVTYRLYQDTDGKYYIGLQNASGTQPLIGPVLSNGFDLAYFNAAGAATAVPSQVASIRFTIRAQTAQPVRSGTAQVYPVDSLTTQVALRNNARF